MSYLSIPTGIENFTKAVISLWFRIPQQTISAAAAAYSTGTSASLLRGVVPFVVMGKKGTGFSDAGDFDFNPTYIGALCFPGVEDKPADALLVVNFETTVKATIDGDSPPNVTASFSAGEQHKLDADKWHHVLISVELTDMKSHGFGWNEDITEAAVTEHIDGYSLLYLALDDVNYSGEDLSGFYPRGHSNQHAVVSDDCYRVANSIQSLAPFEPGVAPHPDGPIPVYLAGGVPPLTIPSAGQPLGLPATPEFVNNIYRVEMAEFQMWTGATLDTGVEDNRRAFVGADGKPVPPDQKELTDEDGHTQHAGSIEFMKRKPNIMLHGSGNWIKGFNTGSSGVNVDADGNVIVIPGGQFHPVGGIKKYTPDPILTPASPSGFAGRSPPDSVRRSLLAKPDAGL